jgi:hypothetical protein
MSNFHLWTSLREFVVQKQFWRWVIIKNGIPNKTATKAANHLDWICASLLGLRAGVHGRIQFLAICVLAVICGLSPCGPALAELSDGPFDKKFSFSAGAFITDHDTRIRLDTDAGRGTELSLENGLGLDATTNIKRIDAAWRYAERHRVLFGVFDLSQTGSRTLDQDLVIDRESYFVGEAVLTDWKMQLFELGYSYRIRANERTRWWLNVSFFIQDTEINVAETVTGGDVSSEDVVLPLPKFGLAVDHAFSKHWFGHAGVDVFKLEIGDVGGSLVDFRATLDYRMTEYFSVGVGWHLINVAVDLDRPVSGWKGRFNWETRGAILYGRLKW